MSAPKPKTLPPRPTRATLLRRLRRLARFSRVDAEVAHTAADDLLLAYLGDPAVTAAFTAIRRWYA